MYATCLVHWDAVPAAAGAGQSLLLGARATQCLCLLSRWPFFSTMRQAGLQEPTSPKLKGLRTGSLCKRWVLGLCALGVPHHRLLSDASEQQQWHSVLHRKL